MRVWIASDHAGFRRKEELKARFPLIEWEDLGTDAEVSVDYPDYADRVAQKIQKESTRRGILICGSGQGMVMRANRFPKVRAALAWNGEIAKLARQHNDANVLCLGSRVMSLDDCEEATRMFLETTFEGGRHETRVRKLGGPWEQC
ncbi:MAG: ribose 5-phosphate isomerase B [Bdellovibrionaceae bacterium]|nr:ribose 5-phosphate isomerase B [Pseudobdellovibrionaceae bacterium]